ncbi:MAG TPA: hypothetical protein VHQ86_04985 [Candidatus Saccharimonadia bacterium]|jgi:Flp pilus assembly protein TadB|nr:hypothetical protein [Candidatus Saccharimonadia bacterium]
MIEDRNSLNRQLDRVIAGLGIHEQTLQAGARAQIMAFTVERAVSMLIQEGKLTADEQAQFKEIFAGNAFGDPRLVALFAAPERQQALENAFAEALDIAVKTLKA